jgi:hypothetical protein
MPKGKWQTVIGGNHLPFENDTKRLQCVWNTFTTVVLHLRWKTKCSLLRNLYSYCLHNFRHRSAIKYSTIYENGYKKRGLITNSTYS